MKTVVLTIMAAFGIAAVVSAQNPYKYESKVVIVPATKQVISNGMTGDTRAESNLNVLQGEMDKYNRQGYKLAQMTNVKGPGNAEDNLVLVFERSTSFREAELYKLIGELTARVDSTSRKYTDSAMIVINTNVLNYLKSIPNDVITQAYKDELSRMIVLQAEEKIREIVEGLKREIRSQSVNQ